MEAISGSMKKCPKCKEEIQKDAELCKHCGTKIATPVAKKVGMGCLGLIILIIIIAIMGSGGSDKSTNTAVDTQEATQLSPEEQTKKTGDPTKPHFEDGNHVVGTDIQPGTYRTREGSSGCYYSRLSGFGGSLGEIISNENTDAPAVITISASDKGFKSTRCGTWTQDLSAITTDKTTFGDGIHIVGTDIESGTYKSSGTDGCYYSRLKGFSGALGDIISNENTDSSAVVTVASTDKGFKSARCGTWSKMK